MFSIVIVIAIFINPNILAFVLTENNFVSYSIPENRPLKKALGYIEDTYLNFTELTTKYGYKSEPHSVITKDGYVLALHRIPSRCPQPNPYPLILMHGIFDSSDTWVFTGPKEGLGYIFADNCYDIWAANTRGNTYSRKHISLDPDRDPRYWEYSFDEHGVYDLPAIIDYVIDVTQRNKVYYIGISQGTTSFFAMTSTLPEYNEKVHLSIHLAPVAWMDHVSPLVKLIATQRVLIKYFLNHLGLKEILGRHQLLHHIAEYLCHIEPVNVCGVMLKILNGENINSLSPRTLSLIGGHLLAGVSVKSIEHFAQIINSHKFQRFDEGDSGNILRYGVNKPPEYDLINITSPVVLMVAHNDLLSDLKDVETLRSKLPNVLETYVVPDPTWSHADYTWHKDAVTLVYQKILQYFKSFNEM